MTERATNLIQIDIKLLYEGRALLRRELRIDQCAADAFQGMIPKGSLIESSTGRVCEE